MAGTPGNIRRRIKGKDELEAYNAIEQAWRVAIGKRLILLRLANGWTQAESARQYLIPVSVLAQNEGGMFAPSIPYARTIKRITGATLDFIYDGDAGGLPQVLVERLSKVPKGSKRPIS